MSTSRSCPSCPLWILSVTCEPIGPFARITSATSVLGGKPERPTSSTATSRSPSCKLPLKKAGPPCVKPVMRLIADDGQTLVGEVIVMPMLVGVSTGSCFSWPGGKPWCNVKTNLRIECTWYASLVRALIEVRCWDPLLADGAGAASLVGRPAPGAASLDGRPARCALRGLRGMIRGVSSGVSRVQISASFFKCLLSKTSYRSPVSRERSSSRTVVPYSPWTTLSSPSSPAGTYSMLSYQLRTPRTRTRSRTQACLRLWREARNVWHVTRSEPVSHQQTRPRLPRQSAVAYPHV